MALSPILPNKTHLECIIAPTYRHLLELTSNAYVTFQNSSRPAMNFRFELIPEGLAIGASPNFRTSVNPTSQLALKAHTWVHTSCRLTVYNRVRILPCNQTRDLADQAGRLINQTEKGKHDRLSLKAQSTTMCCCSAYWLIQSMMLGKQNSQMR